MDKERKIREAQRKAKELGHCLCNFKLTCPCLAYQKNSICMCCDSY